MNNPVTFKVPQTPAPWCEDYIAELMRMGRKSITVSCVCSDDEWEPDESDAPLMAAAPELYLALENLIKVVPLIMNRAKGNGPEFDISPELEAAREACKKARKEYVPGRMEKWK